MSSITAVMVALLISILLGTSGHQVTEKPEIYNKEVVLYEQETVVEEMTMTIRRREAVIQQSADIFEEETELIELEVEELEETEPYFALYSVNGHVLDEDLQEFLYFELVANGIEWWMPYAMMQMYLESQFNVYDVTNGLDYGILQYRKAYWPEKAARYGLAGADIFDPYAQIHVYVQETRKRLKEFGCDIYETISRHKTSDYGSYDAAYVNYVLDHKVVRIR